MSAADGTILGAVKIHDAGPEATRFNLSILSEGYRAEEMPKFAADADAFVQRLFTTPPYDGLECAINIFRLDVASVESGADDPHAPPNCPGSGAHPRTYFDATFCGYGIERLILTNSWLVEYALWSWLPFTMGTVILVNSAKRGGNGNRFATVSTSAGWDWAKVAIHEMGHAIFQLGDEYDFLTACDDSNREYEGPEPEWPNVAKDVTRAGLKWTDLVKPSTLLPTFSNPNCDECYDGDTGYPSKTVGAFEGAGLFHCKLYRSEPDCLMRYGDDLCAVCSSVIRDYMAVFKPTCVAPTFGPTTNGVACFLVTLVLALVVFLLSFESWNPQIECTRKRLRFRIQNCSVGNDDPCLDLG